MEARSGDPRSSDNRKRRYGDRRSREKPPTEKRAQKVDVTGRCARYFGAGVVAINNGAVAPSEIVDASAGVVDESLITATFD